MRMPPEVRRTYKDQRPRCVTNQGSCSGSSRLEVASHATRGGLEIEFEVDSNINGQRWQVQITDHGATIFRGNRTTVAPSGSFEVEVGPPTGPDRTRSSVGRRTPRPARPAWHASPIRSSRAAALSCDG